MTSPLPFHIAQSRRPDACKIGCKANEPAGKLAAREPSARFRCPRPHLLFHPFALLRPFRRVDRSLPVQRSLANPLLSPLSTAFATILLVTPLSTAFTYSRPGVWGRSA